jgi:hypothetical protein
MNLEGAEGWMVGEPHRGMRSMFTMMNAARLNVGNEGVSLSEAAYQAALSFAKDRRQSRSMNPTRRERGTPADTILVHPDVRRMLLRVKSTTEGLRGLVAWIGMCYDVWHHSEDEAAREEAGDLVALLTPLIKSYGSERGFQNVSDAMQVMGGAGFTRDWPVEQYMRDLRIAMIYEGTNHIQALDLVGRKLAMHDGRLLRVFAQQLQAINADGDADPRLGVFTDALQVEARRLHATTLSMGEAAAEDPDVIGAAASNYLNQFALVTLGYVWAVQAKAALALPEGDKMRTAKLQTARFYFEMVLPEAAMYAQKVSVGAGPVSEIDVDLL